jgi:hypothetical protein
MKGALDINARRSGGESQTVSYSEDEKDLVSAEELKHEMSAEKGLAWFDLGNGRIVKGRSFWFNAEIPETWEGREYIVRPERFEVDEVGLADWVDEQILAQEEGETTERFAPKRNEQLNIPAAAVQPAVKNQSQSSDNPNPVQTSSFKVNMDKNPGRSRGMVTTLAKALPRKTADTQEKKGTSAPKTGPFKLRK